MPLEFQRQLKRRLHQPIRKIRRGRLQILLQRPRDALPFGRLQAQAGAASTVTCSRASDCTVTNPRCRFTSDGLHPAQDRFPRLAGVGV